MYEPKFRKLNPYKINSKEKKIENFYFTTQPDLWKDLHLLAMKYRNMNVFQRLLFRIKSKLFRPKLKFIDYSLLSDCTTISENIKREDKSYNDMIKEYFNA